MFEIFAYRTVAVMHLQARTESLKPFIASGVGQSVKLVLPTERKKSLGRNLLY